MGIWELSKMLFDPAEFGTSELPEHQEDGWA